MQNEIIWGILLVIPSFSAITKGTLPPTASLNLEEIHLVRCLTYISHRYFSPGRSLVISLPATYQDVQQELIAEIHQNSIWPVVVTVDGKISKPNKKDLIERDGSHIILIPDGNIISFYVEITGLGGDGTKWTRLWNSETRFVVAGANELSMSQKLEIFDYLSSVRIYNCIIVSREHYVINKEYSSRINMNDVDTDMELGVYTWFPYQNSKSCTEVNDITLLDSWVISAQGNFTKNTDLFPGKISNSFNGCPMKAVLLADDSYFVMIFVNRTDSDGNFETYPFGMEMYLLDLVLKQMNMTIFLVPTPEGFEIEKKTTGNLIKTMLAKEVYIALGNIGTRYLIDPFLDFTNFYYIMSYRWYVPCSVEYPRWRRIFRILSVELWLVLFISIVIVAILTTLVGRYTCTSEWQVYKTLTSSLTKLWAVILGVSVSTMPRTPSLRSLFLAWLCFSVAFSTAFQAFLTKFLINTGYKPRIQNKDELYESDIKLYYRPECNFIFENVDDTEVSKVQRNLANCLWYTDCLDWTKYHKNVSILDSDLDFAVYSAAGYTLDEKSEPFLCRLGDEVIYNDYLRMIILQGDPLMRRVTEIIDRVVEAGLYNFWISKKINLFKLRYGETYIVAHHDGYFSFNLYHMQPAFYLLLMGWCLSALCFIFELLCNRVLSKRR